jgi:hypothetical protein
MSGSWDYFSFNSGNGEVDTDFYSNNVTIPPGLSAAYVRLANYVMRPSSGDRFGAVFLVYDRELDVVVLFYDSNVSDTLDSGDELLSQVSVSEW